MATPLSADKLLRALRDEGLHVVEHRSWRTNNRNHKGLWGPVHGVMIHHTVSSGTASSVELCYNGHSALPGPLCHGVIAKDGTVHLVGNGRANHAGLGDDDVLRAVIAEKELPPDNEANTDGNQHFYGFEAVNLGDGKDPWPAAQVLAIERAAAAVCRAHGWSQRSVLGHLEWQPGKVDPRGFTMDGMRARIATRLSSTEDEDMPSRSNPKVKATTNRPGSQWLPVPLTGGLVTGPADYSGTVFLRLSGVPAGATIQARYVETRNGERSKTGPIVEHLGSSGDTFIGVTNGGGHVDTGAALGVEYIVFDDADTHTLVSGQAQLLYWK